VPHFFRYNQLPCPRPRNPVLALLLLFLVLRTVRTPLCVSDFFFRPFLLFTPPPPPFRRWRNIFVLPVFCPRSWIGVAFSMSLSLFRDHFPFFCCVQCLVPKNAVFFIHRVHGPAKKLGIQPSTEAFLPFQGMVLPIYPLLVVVCPLLLTSPSFQVPPHAWGIQRFVVSSPRWITLSRRCCLPFFPLPTRNRRFFLYSSSALLLRQSKSAFFQRRPVPRDFSAPLLSDGRKLEHVKTTGLFPPLNGVVLSPRDGDPMKFSPNSSKKAHTPLFDWGSSGYLSPFLFHPPLPPPGAGRSALFNAKVPVWTSHITSQFLVYPFPFNPL